MTIIVQMAVITHQNIEVIVRKNKDGERNVCCERHSCLLGLILLRGAELFSFLSKQEDGHRNSKQMVLAT
jgi:hypothetical protein